MQLGNAALLELTFRLPLQGKCEFLNPFGSVKDRVSLRSELRLRKRSPSLPLTRRRAVITQAEEQGLIHPHTGSCIFEGTSGSTGISIAGIARAKGYKARELALLTGDSVARR